MTRSGQLDVAPPPLHECGDACDHPAEAGVSAGASGVQRFVSTPLGIVALFVAAVLAVDAGGTDDGAGLCVFRRCTGGYCPGCGLTRAARHLTRGEVGAAWTDHPWMVLVSAQAAVIGGVWIVARAMARRVRWARPVRLLAVANVAALLVIWIVRLTNGSIPRFF